ncbi:MAG: hypothetical protein AB7L65_00970 [Hyphomonadaceae bacterium]
MICFPCWRGLGLAAALAFVLALAACAPRETGCNRSAQAQIVFSASDTADTVTAQSLGPSCDAAVGVVTIRTPDGRPVWAWAAPLHPTFGNLFAAGREGPPGVETAQRFLSRWAALRVATTAAAPPWPQEAVQPPGAETSLDRLTYEDVRARRLPMACQLSGVAREICLFWEPGAAAAAPLLERRIRAAPEEKE